MDPEIWGPGTWLFIHSIAINYPEVPNSMERKDMYNFFTTLAQVIPCTKCKDNYIKHLNMLPLSSHLDNRNDLFNWTVEMHNMVNLELGKPVISTDEAIKIYKDLYLNKELNKKAKNKKDEAVYTNYNSNYRDYNKNNTFIYYLIKYKYIYILLCLIGIALYVYKHVK